ncbi:FkbM family methyltransferase [Microcoleus sp.]|uniref:FkbM family methyltransferase n=1 Tax=Microcoleus sp. TaxID=44472 RepID=UPI00403EF327
MGIVRMGPPIEIISQLKAAYGINNFIETRTYQGHTAYWASQVFEQVFTTEYSQDLYQKVTEKYGHIKNIDFLYGDSRNLLDNTVSQLQSPSLFWLDAHWSGGPTYGETDECPLLAEIEIINRSDCDHFIFIDDARLFLSPPPQPHSPQQWPDISAVLKLLNSGKNSRHIVIIEDVIIAVPARAKKLIVQYCQDLLTTLGYTGSGKEEQNHQSTGVSANNINKGESLNNYELKIIENFIASGNVVFDLGANIGSWTNQVLNICPDVQIHLFEPAPPIYQTLLQNLAEPIKTGQIVLNNLAIAHQQEIRKFYYSENFLGASKFHRRFETEKQYNIQSPQPFQILTATLDDYVQTRGIKRINFLKIDTEGDELEVLRGASNLLQKGKVDYIQFEYGGTFVDANITLKQVFEHLQKFRYTIFKIRPHALQALPEFLPEYENYEYSNFLAVNERFTALIFSQAPNLLDLQQLCGKHSVAPRGIIHIGAHDGKEIARYRAMGVQRVLFVEANPAVFERLKTNIAGFPNVVAVNCAVSNINGTSTLYVTSMDQSSSILPLKEHQKFYPEIKEVERVFVESRTLDTLLEELQINPADFNILNIDIQGAELLALQGATNVLKYIEAINTEVNYEELYEGCALIDEIDDFLEMCGFDRVATTTPFHPSWGDAFYVKKPAVTISTLGRNGRFANQIFQYAFLKIYSKEHNLKVETPAWIGQYLFGCNDSPISQELPVVTEPTNKLSAASIPNAKEIFKNVNFWGYFQYHTKFYKPHQEYFRSLFKPVGEIETKMKEAIARLRSRGQTIVGLHLRRGDYGYEDFFIAPSEWYKEWLKGLWETLDQPILFIASDEPEKVLSDFEEYNPITTKDLGLELPEAEFYPDFYLLSQCDITAISNSSFSFAACMLNETGKFFFRPHLSAEKLIPFDPWDSEPILRNYMPIHFFTIVLNGQPFIHYHIDVLQQLPFKWHWHIIEGVAEQKHDSAWMLSLGGKITDELHCRGRSKDGTSEYIDEIARLYPKNITVYRKPEDIFWEGKREMVNAPLENINQECLLWQLDVDELWTAEQICTARQMFINHPEKTAAFYWCWYFVGENLVISTRNCYAENPQQDWLRTWRFKPGAFWASHEPPRLVEALPNSECRDVAAVNPFLHEETEKQGLVFQHFAYVTLEQLRFKQIYYGYKNAVVEWMALQAQTKLPVALGNYFSWVQDETRVDTAESLGIAPIAQRKNEKNMWHFVQPKNGKRQTASVEKFTPRVIVDGVFFQLYNTGIARVWRSLLEEWVTQKFAKHIIVLDRAGTAPKIPGIAYCPVPPYDYDKTDGDREMLQQVCDELEADLFISTYYTTPLSTPSVFIAYDMTPEVFETNLDEPMWREKHYGIRHASAYITISRNTASDLLKFFPDIPPELVKVAHCGVPQNLSPASPEEIESFKIKYNLSKPYFMMVGAAGGHKNAPLFLEAFAQLPNQPEFDIICTAHSALTKDEFEPYTSGSTVHKLPLSDEELKAAFSGAVALVYPSQYEGFGLPILEAMACGCPVITCPNASIPEVAGEAALYVQDDDVEEMTIALVNIQKPEVRESLIAAGLEQAKKFSWSKMAKMVTSVFIKVFQQKESMLIRQENSKKILPERDYISPGFAIVLPDECFPNMIVGDTEIQPWPYLRREVPHNWYVDKRHPTVGFLSRDEAHILYNTALKFKGKKALEIGCWLGWSACHLALAGVKLEIVDPLLARPDFYESVSNSLQAAGVLDSIHLVAGYSPQAVEELAAQLQTKWSLIFIDGNHEAPGPLNDAIICEQLAAQDALILFHDLAAPDVAQGLDYFNQKGWQTMVYQTMQIMGVAWRGNVEPVLHLPDPKVNWVLPAHLQNYTVSGMSNQSLYREVAVRQVHEMMQQAVALLNSNKPVEAMRIAEQAASLNINVPGMHYLRSICLSNVGRHKEALAAAKAELAIDPTHRQAQKQVESLTKAILRSPIKIPTQQRSWNTTLARENMLSIQNATMNYSYRGVPMLKNPFDFALYPVLIWNLKPRTIIEIGSKDGGSAVWLGDMLNNFGIDGHIYSIDIVEVTSVQHPRVTYMEGNGRALQEILTPGFINSLPRPLLVIEDADHSYETSKHVLEFFHPYLKLEEYIVIEDGIISDLVQDASYNIGPHKALKEFLSEHEDEYEIDSSYCDYFGYNMTWCTNGFLKKVKESSSLGEPFLNKLFHYVEEYQPVSQVGSSVDLSGDRQKFAELIQKGKECFVKGEIERAIATFTQALEVHQSSLIAHNYLTSLYWQVGDVQQSLQHHIQAQFRNIAFDNTLTEEFQELLSVIRPYTLLSEARLFSLYSLARQICLDDIPGNFVECGSYKGGSAALLAVVIKRYSLRPRLVYAFDTFEGMPEPTEADKHNGIPANLTVWGVGTLKAPLTDNLDVICHSLDVGDIVIAVKGLFAQTLPESKSEIGSIALLHADGDWYESTMDIFNNIYDRVVPNGFIQIDDYGHWEGCKNAIHEFERGCGQSFALRFIDYTGVWFQKEHSVHQDCNHWRTFWHLAQASEKMGNIELAKKAAQAVLKIVPKLVKAENLLNRDRSQLELVVSPEVSLSAELDDFLNNLRLREINIILFPDWQQPEDSLCLQLEGVMTTLLAHKEPSKITALLDTSNISEEDANLVLSSVIMNILMQEDLDETDVPEVSLLGNLSEMQWKALLPCIHYRVVLENENQQAVAQAGAASLASLKAANLSI